MSEANLPQCRQRRELEGAEFWGNLRDRGWRDDCKERWQLPAGDRVAHDEEVRRRSIERDVLRYVLERPAAKDTADGVRHWWLRNGAGLTARDVRVVLAALAEKGWLAARGMQGEAGEDALVYELNASCMDEIRRHLAARSETEEPNSPATHELPEGTRLG